MLCHVNKVSTHVRTFTLQIPMADKSEDPDPGPGAARFGNFINYYQFNPPENRLQFLPKNLRDLLDVKRPPLTVLDVGCNAGVSFTSILSFPICVFLIQFAKKNL